MSKHRPPPSLNYDFFGSECGKAASLKNSLNHLPPCLRGYRQNGIILPGKIFIKPEIVHTVNPLEPYAGFVKTRALFQFYRAQTAVLDKPARGRGSRSSKKSSASSRSNGGDSGAFKWEHAREAVLDSMQLALTPDASRLWRQGVPDRCFVGLFLRLSCKMLELPETVKNARQAQVALALISEPFHMAPGMETEFSAAVFLLVRENRHLAEPVARLCCRLVEKHGDARLGAELVREVGRMDMPDVTRYERIGSTRLRRGSVPGQCMKTYTVLLPGWRSRLALMCTTGGVLSPPRDLYVNAWPRLFWQQLSSFPFRPTLRFLLLSARLFFVLWIKSCSKNAAIAAPVVNVSDFLRELVQVLPGTVHAHASILLPHLSSRPYQIRNAVVYSLGEVITAAHGERKAAGQEERAGSGGVCAGETESTGVAGEVQVRF